MGRILRYCLNRDFHPERYTQHAGWLYQKRADGSTGRSATFKEYLYHNHPRFVIAMKTSLVFFTALSICLTAAAIVVTGFHLGGFNTWHGIISAKTPTGIAMVIALSPFIVNALLVGSLLGYDACSKRRRIQPQSQISIPLPTISPNESVTVTLPTPTSQSEPQEPELSSAETEIDLSQISIDNLPTRIIALPEDDPVLFLDTFWYDEGVGGIWNTGELGKRFRAGVAPLVWQYLKPGEFYIERMNTEIVTASGQKDIAPQLILFMRNKASHYGEAQRPTAGGVLTDENDPPIPKADGVPITYRFPIIRGDEERLPNWVVRRLSGIRYSPADGTYMQTDQTYTQVLFEATSS